MEYLHFNTDVIYRFGSDGVIDFGGEEDGMIDIDTVTWNQDDIPVANNLLNKLREELNLPTIDITSYEKSKKGTEKLLADLLVKGGIPHRYLLGCIICHQLQYTIPLEVTFMTGEHYADCDCDCDCDNDINNKQYEIEMYLSSDSE